MYLSSLLKAYTFYYAQRKNKCSTRKQKTIHKQALSKKNCLVCENLFFRSDFLFQQIAKFADQRFREIC